jgi:hypothetical protein
MKASIFQFKGFHIRQEEEEEEEEEEHREEKNPPAMSSHERVETILQVRETN